MKSLTILPQQLKNKNAAVVASILLITLIAVFIAFVVQPKESDQTSKKATSKDSPAKISTTSDIDKSIKAVDETPDSDNDLKSLDSQINDL